jgi:hypothetical protein
MIKKFFIITFLFIIFYIFVYYFNFSPKIKYIVAGTGNPGEIYVYEIKSKIFNKIKTINTGYKFVHTVRIGDIYNNGSKQIVAGIFNSFFAEPYGCKVVSYDVKDFKESIVDDVGDLRCKDLTIGDVDNDGKNEVILATHGRGIVRIYKWTDRKWNKEDLESNYISKIDAQEKTNHRVDNKDLPCKECVVQTAVHIVKVGDVDNDGKNELITTMSSPLELQKVDEISYIRLYKKINGKWQNQTIDQLSNREFRSITIGDIYNQKKNVLLVGIGSPRNEKGSLYVYEYSNGKWGKRIIHNDQDEKNMKGVALGNINDTGKQTVLLATGFPNAKIMILESEAKDFKKKLIGNIASLFKLDKPEFNSMVALISRANKNTNLIIGGTTTYPDKKIGWEGADQGYIVIYSKKGNAWIPKIIEARNILGMDMEK